MSCFEDLSYVGDMRTYVCMYVNMCVNACEFVAKVTTREGEHLSGDPLETVALAWKGPLE